MPSRGLLGHRSLVTALSLSALSLSFPSWHRVHVLKSYTLFSLCSRFAPSPPLSTITPPYPALPCPLSPLPLPPLSQGGCWRAPLSPPAPARQRSRAWSRAQERAIRSRSHALDHHPIPPPRQPLTARSLSLPSPPHPPFSSLLPPIVPP